MWGRSLAKAATLWVFLLSPCADASAPWAGEGLIGKSKDGKFGFMDLRGNFVIEPAWDRVQTFSEGRVAVMKGGKWGFIDQEGKLIAQPEWDSVQDFSDGVAIVTKNRLKGAIDLEGRVIVPAEWRWMLPANEGFILYQGTGAQDSGFFDTKGKIKLRPPEGFTAAGSFSEGLAVVTETATGKAGFMNAEGEVVIPCKWNRAEGFSEGLAAVTTREKTGPKEWIHKTGFIDQSGEIVIPLEWEQGAVFGKSFFKHGLAPVSRGGKGGFIDKTGKLAIPLKWATVGSFSRSGVAYVATVVDREWGWINAKGDYIQQPARIGAGLDKFWVDFYPIFTYRGTALDPMKGKLVLEYEGGEWKCTADNPFFRLTNKAGAVISCRVLAVAGDKVTLIKGDDRKEYTVPLSTLASDSVRALREFAANQ